MQPFPAFHEFLLALPNSKPRSYEVCLFGHQFNLPLVLPDESVHAQRVEVVAGHDAVLSLMQQQGLD